MRRFITLALLAVFPFIIACSGLNGLHPGNGTELAVKGTKARGYNATWNAAVKVLGQQGFTIAESDKKTGVIKATKGAVAGSWSETLGVFITPAKVKQKHYTVEVVSQKRAKSPTTGQNWEKVITDGIKAELGL